MRLMQPAVLLAAGVLAATGLPAPGPARTPAAAVSAQLPEPHLAVVPQRGHFADLLRCLRGRGVATISAHRGGTEPGYPENAIETFARTLAQAPMFLETDLRMTADSVIILLHDDTLDRTTTGTGPIGKRRLAELAELRLRDNSGAVTPFRIPTLDQALTWARERATLLLDVKPDVPVERVVEAVRKHGAFDRTLIIVYSIEDAARAKRADSRSVLSVPVKEEADIARLREAGLNLTQIIIWTDVGRTLDHGPWTETWPAELPLSGGTFWFLDREVRESGDARVFRTLAERGMVLIATDLHHLAWHTLDLGQDTLGGYRACLR